MAKFMASKGAEAAEDENEDVEAGDATAEKTPAAKKTKAAAKEKKEKVLPMKRKSGESKEAPPMKRKSVESKAVPVNKRSGRGRKKAPQVTDGVAISDAILKKARTNGYETQLKNLAVRPEIIASGRSAEKLLKALEASNGLVNPAKRSLLGA